MVVVLCTAPVVLSWSSSLDSVSSGVLQGFRYVVTVSAAAVVLFSPGVAAALALVRFVPMAAVRMSLVAGAAVCASGAVWWIVFWVWMASGVVGQMLTAAVLVVAGAVIVVLLARVQQTARALMVVLAIPIAAVLAPAGLFFAGGDLSQPLASIARVTMFTADNVFPLDWVVRVADDLDLRAPTLGGYSLADRPPLQAAVALPLDTFQASREVTGQAVGSLLQGLAITGAVLLLKTFGLRGGRLVVATLLVTLTFLVSAYTVFVWPKLFASALILIAMAVLFEARSVTPSTSSPPQDRAQPYVNPETVAVVVVSGLVGLSLLAHPVGLLSAPMLLVVWLRTRMPRPSKKTVAVAATLALLLIGPWVIYLATYDAGSSLVSRQQLAGVIDPDDSRSAPVAMVEEIVDLGVGGWLGQRGANLATFVGWDHSFGVYSSESFTGGSFSRQAVNAAVQVPLLSGGILALFVPLLLAWRRLPRPVTSVAFGGGVSCVLWLLVQYGPPEARAVTHHAPLAALLGVAVAVAAATVLLVPRRVTWALVATQAGIWLWLIWYSVMNPHCGPSCEVPSVRIRVESLSPALMALSMAGILMLIFLVGRVDRLYAVTEPSEPLGGRRQRTARGDSPSG